MAAAPTFMNSMTCARVVRASRRRCSASLSPAGAAAPTSGTAAGEGAPPLDGLGFASATASSRACTAHRALGGGAAVLPGAGGRQLASAPSSSPTASIQINGIQQVHQHFTHRISVSGGCASLGEQADECCVVRAMIHNGADDQPGCKPGNTATHDAKAAASRKQSGIRSIKRSRCRPSPSQLHHCTAIPPPPPGGTLPPNPELALSPF